jgi:O-antigen/teichoic acid export membrane protein
MIYIDQIIDRIKSQKAKELFIGSFWSLGGSIFSKGLLFIAWVFVGRILGKEGYGYFGIIRNTIVMFATFAGLGLGATASKFVSEFILLDRLKVERIIGLTLSFGLVAGIIIGLITFIISPWIAMNMLNAPNLLLDLQMASIILFFNSLNGAQIGVLQGLQAFRSLASINIYQALFSFPIFIIGAYYGGVHGSVFAFAFYNIVICFFSHIAINRKIHEKNITINYHEAWKEKKIILTYSIPAFLGGLVVTPLKWFSDVMLVNIPHGFQEMGMFSAALTFNTVFVLLTSMLDAPFLTIMSKNKKDSMNSTFNRFNVIAPWAIGFFIIAPFLVFPEIGTLFFGKDYSSNKFKWTFIFILVYTLWTMYKQGFLRILSVHNLMWLGALDNLIFGVSLLGGFYYFRCFGSVGLSISYTIAYIISTILLFPILYKKKLIPKNIIFSPCILLIWIIISILIVQNFYHLMLFYKIVILLFSYILGFITFRSSVFLYNK